MPFCQAIVPPAIVPLRQIPISGPPAWSSQLMMSEKQRPDNDDDDGGEEHKDRDPVDPMHIL